MKANVGDVDRWVRLVIGAILALVGGYVFKQGALFWIFVIIGIILLLTALFSWCPLYSILKISTRK